MADKDVTTKLTLHGDSSGMISSMQKAEAQIKSFEGGMANITGTIGSMAGAIGVLVGVGSMGALLKSSIDAADNLSKLSQKVGVNIEQLSGMAYAAELADVSAEQLGKGMGKLAKAMYEAAGDPTSGPAKTFRDLGVSVTDSAGKLRNTDAVMMDVAGRMARMDDGARKTALSMEVFGKSGADLIPLLNSGKEGIKEATDEARRFGLVLSAEAGRQAEEFNDNLTRLKSRASGAAMTLANELLPEINSLVDKFAKGGDIGTSPFMTGLRSIKAEFLRVAMLADKAGGSLTAMGMLLYGPGSMAGYKPSEERFNRMAELNMMFEQRYADSEKEMQKLANLEVGLDESGNPIKPKGGKSGGRGGDNGRGKPGAGPTAPVQYLPANDLLLKNILATEKKAADEARKDREAWNSDDNIAQGKKMEADEAWLTSVAAVREQNRQEDLAKSSGFFAMQLAMSGDASAAELYRIDQEQQAWEYSWAMNADNYAVYEARNTQIAEYHERQRSDVARREAQFKLGLAASTFGNMATIADAFYQLSGKKSKEAFKAYQVTKSFETAVTTHSAAMKAYDSMVGVPFVGPGLAVLAATAAYAAGAVAIDGIWSGSVGGSMGSGGSSGSSAATPVTQPITNTSASQAPIINIHLNGTTLADPQALTRWSEDYLMPTIRDLKTRGVTS